jgi:hypothetical protein
LKKKIESISLENKMISKNGKFKKFIIKDKEKENDFINKT